MGLRKRALGAIPAWGTWRGSGNPLVSAVLFPRGARVRSVPQCYFDRVPDKPIWTCWPMFGYFGRLFFLDRSIRTPKGVLRTKLYLGFLGLHLEFGGNLAPKPGPHRQSRRLLAARIELLPFFIQFPSYVYHINQHSFRSYLYIHLYFSLPLRLCQGKMGLFRVDEFVRIMQFGN